MNIKNVKKTKYISCKNDVLIYTCRKCNNKSYKSKDALKNKFSNTY